MHAFHPFNFVTDKLGYVTQPPSSRCDVVVVVQAYVALFSHNKTLLRLNLGRLTT